MGRHRTRGVAKPQRATPARRFTPDERTDTSADSQTGRVLRLQEEAGNSAVATLLQRQPTEAPPKKKSNEPFLKKGYTGKGVKKLQQRLNAQGTEPPLKIDGVFGKLTHAAVVEFQTAHELEPDGKVGKLTWEALDEVAETQEIEATTEALGEHAKERMDYVNDVNDVNPQTLDRGVHYSYNYKDLCEKSGRADLWKDDYRSGYADPQYFVRIGWMDWVLKPGMSASAAVKSWLRGLTIAECNSALVAIEIDSLRAAMGDAKFDEHYGSTDKEIPVKDRLRIKQGRQETPIENLIVFDPQGQAGERGTKNNRPVKPGDWCYFYNHPRYLLKHPGGAWQGENALYEGRDASGAQTYSGMGASGKTEDDLFKEMFGAYNLPRDEEDAIRLKEKFPDGNVDPKYELKEDGSGEFPPTLKSIDEIEAAPEYELEGEKRKGGYVASSTKRLDPDKVKELAGS
jgi:Putative peptidoglycan binding domain/Protein-glutamine gamma-glutamyltransferase